MAAFVLSAPAWAHHDPPIVETALGTTTVPTIDGVLGAAEWADAAEHLLDLPGHAGTVLVKHDDTYLYMAMKIFDSAPVSPNISVYFDDDHDGIKAAGDDAIIAFGTFGQDFFYNPDGPGGASHYNDLTDGGTSDTLGAGSIDSATNYVYFELRQPLRSADAAHDIQSSIGDTLGVDYQYESGGFVRWPGADSFDPSDWADLVLSATVALDTTIDSPANESVIVGDPTITFSANQSGATFTCRLDPAGETFPFPCESPQRFGDLADGRHFFDVRAIVGDTSDATPAQLSFYTLRTLPAGRIVFESDRPGSNGLDIYSMRPDGSDVQRLTGDEGNETRPTLSPDGRRLAYEKLGRIYVKNVDGSGDATPIVTTGINRAPMFSPNGRDIAFERDTGDGQFDIYRVPATGGTPIRITFSSGNDVSPSWSPNGSYITFDSDRDGNREIYRILSKGSSSVENELRRLTTNAGIDADPDWSPDGSQILFVSGRDTPELQVYTMNATFGESEGGVTNVSGGPAFAADPTWAPDGEHIAFVRDAGGMNFNVWIADRDGTQQVRLMVGAAPQRNSFPDWAGAAGIATDADITISGPRTSEAGAAVAAIDDIPVEAIRGGDDAAGMESSPIGGIPIGGIPIGGIPIGGIPIGGIPIGGIPIGGIPIGGIGWSAADLLQNGLGGVPLSTIPLEPPDRWEDHLALVPQFAGTPPQNVTLAQVLGTAVVNGISFEALDLASSPIGGIPIGGIAFGALPIGGIPIGGIGGTSEAQNLADWCAWLNAQAGYSCTDPSSLSGTTMVGLALRGAPIGGIDLDSIPIGGIPIGGIPIGGIAVGSGASTPIGGIDLAGTPIGGIPIGGIDLAISPIGGIALGNLTDAAKAVLFTCDAACAGPTIRDEFLAGHLEADATIADVGYYQNGDGSPITLAQLLQGLPPDTSLADLLGTLLASTAYDWESLPLGMFPLQDYASAGGLVTYDVGFTLLGSPGITSADVVAHAPDGARYVNGSSTIAFGEGAPVALPDPAFGDDGMLRWELDDVGVGSAGHIKFQVKPGLELETETATAEVSAPGLSPVATDAPAATLITETFPGNTSPGSEFVPTIVPDTLYVGYTPNGSNRDYFRIAAPPPGTQRIFHLSHLQADLDMVVYGQAPAPLRVPRAGAIPLGGQQVLDVRVALDQRTQAIGPEPQTDIPQNAVASASVLGISDNRGLEDEEITLNTAEDVAGMQTIQITSFDGDFSNQPWLLRVEDIPAVPLPTGCAKPALSGAGAPHAMPAIGATAQTLYLFNSKRFGDLYGAQAEEDVWNKLQTLASRTDAAGGAVIPIEADGAVANAYGQWDASLANYCSPGKANDVARAIGVLLDNITTPSIKYIVLVGDDTVLPYGRELDNTSYANERGYVTTFMESLAPNNQYMSAYGIGFLPTDDNYGDVNYAGTGPYVPELSVGRLVEKPGQILAQLDQYIQRNGVISPSASLVTGYDFLKDGATAVSNALKPTVGSANARELINDSWSKTDLVNAMFPATGAPNIASLNAHYDHSRALPADENAANRETILFTTDDVASRGPTAVNGRIIFTVGCHSGLSVSDFVVGPTLQPDWAQTYAAGGAIVYMGNYGYGLGDTVAVAYSERLNELFAQRLNGTMTVGQALTFAKQEYATAPALSGYDLKVIDEAAMSGLPMYRLGTLSTPTAPMPAPLTTDPATGLPSAMFDISPSFTRVNTSVGSYYTSDGGASFQHRRPNQPLSNLDVTQPNLVAHGVLITKATSVDETGFDAAFSRVVEDSSAFAPELTGEVIYPTKLPSVTSFLTPAGTRQRAVFFAGQFRTDGVPDAQGVGVQRRFTNLGGSILYAPPAAKDFVPPSFGTVQVTRAGSIVGFAVDVTDFDETGASRAPEAVKRVIAIYKDASGGTWKFAELSRVGSRWSGGGPVSGTTVEWFIQAVDLVSNVGVTSNKADVQSLTLPQPTGNISAALSGTLHPSGWYTSAVEVTITAGQDVSIRKSLDGAPFQDYTAPFEVTATGVHLLSFSGSDGSHGSVAIPIDVTSPTISFAEPGILTLGQDSNFNFFACADAGSGVASCQVTSIDTSTITVAPATRQATVTATDRVGRETTAQGSYRVLYPFRGFLQPISNLPFLNSVNAGQAVPVKFSLGGNRGLDIFPTGSPSSAPIACDTQAPVDEAVPTLTAGNSSLSYDSGNQTYNYVWKTDKAWAGQCRALKVTLIDGSVHTANFKFK